MPNVSSGLLTLRRACRWVTGWGCITRSTAGARIQETASATRGLRRRPPSTARPVTPAQVCDIWTAHQAELKCELLVLQDVLGCPYTVQQLLLCG